MGSKDSNPRRSNGAKRNALRRRVRLLGEPCHLCGYEIPDGVPVMHPLYMVLDELVPVSKGGSPYAASNVRAAHRCCNGWRGAKELTPALYSTIRNRFERTHLGMHGSSERFKTSRRW